MYLVFINHHLYKKVFDLCFEHFQNSHFLDDHESEVQRQGTSTPILSPSQSQESTVSCSPRLGSPSGPSLSADGEPSREGPQASSVDDDWDLIRDGGVRGQSSSPVLSSAQDHSVCKLQINCIFGFS